MDCLKLLTVHQGPFQLCVGGVRCARLHRCSSSLSTWNNDDIMSLLDHIDCLLHIDLRVGTGDLHGFARAGGRGAVTSEDDVREGTIHGLVRNKQWDKKNMLPKFLQIQDITKHLVFEMMYYSEIWLSEMTDHSWHHLQQRCQEMRRWTYHTHDVREDRARGTNEGAHNGQQVVVEKEALGAEGPAGITVKHRDHDGHVGTSDGCRQGHALQKSKERGQGNRVERRGCRSKFTAMTSEQSAAVNQKPEVWHTPFVYSPGDDANRKCDPLHGRTT